MECMKGDGLTEMPIRRGVSPMGTGEVAPYSKIKLKNKGRYINKRQNNEGTFVVELSSFSIK